MTPLEHNMLAIVFVLVLVPFIAKASEVTVHVALGIAEYLKK